MKAAPVPWKFLGLVLAVTVIAVAPFWVMAADPSDDELQKSLVAIGGAGLVGFGKVLMDLLKGSAG